MLTKILRHFYRAIHSMWDQDEDRYFPCGMVVGEEIIAKICSRMRSIERGG